MYGLVAIAVAINFGVSDKVKYFLFESKKIAMLYDYAMVMLKHGERKIAMST